MADRATDPLVGFHFRLEVSGPVPLTGYFAECAGIGSESEVVTTKVVDKKGIGAEMKQPGRLKWQDITLKRGITDNMEIWKWRQLIEEGQIMKARSNGSIVMMSQDYKDVARWDFVNAWPSKVTGPSVKADSNEIGVEEMVIVHEGLIRKA